MARDKRPDEVAPGRRFEAEACQKQLPTEAEVAEWWRRWAEERADIVTEAVSGLVVMNCRSKHREHDTLTQPGRPEAQATGPEEADR